MISSQQGLYDAHPQPRFPPALIATGYRRPGPIASGELAPRAAGAGDPEHPLDDQAMIDCRSAGGRFLRWKEEAELLPGRIRERRETEQRGGRGKPGRNVRGLNRPVFAMAALSLGLMLTAEVGPPQAPHPHRLGLTQRVHQPAEFRDAPAQPTGICSPFFPGGFHCARRTTNTACAKSARVT